MGITQLILYATFYKSTQRQLAARKANAEMGLAETGTQVGPTKLNSVGQAHNEYP